MVLGEDPVERALAIVSILLTVVSSQRLQVLRWNHSAAAGAAPLGYPRDKQPPVQERPSTEHHVGEATFRVAPITAAREDRRTQESNVSIGFPFRSRATGALERRAPYLVDDAASRRRSAAAAAQRAYALPLRGLERLPVPRCDERRPPLRGPGARPGPSPDASARAANLRI